MSSDENATKGIDHRILWLSAWNHSTFSAIQLHQDAQNYLEKVKVRKLSPLTKRWKEGLGKLG